MKLQCSHQSTPPDEAGQAAALVALLLFFAFLPLAALAIDGSMIYLVRRDLQNAADASALAACTEIAQAHDSATALAAAQNTIQSNLGAWTQFASPNTGTGVNLIRGIEINSSDVRVAVQGRAPTVLTQFVGRGETMVTAQAHCLANAGGGLLPIAVRRDYNNQKDVVAWDGPNNKNYLNTSIEDFQNWPSPYPPYAFTVPVPVADYTASPSKPGPSIPILDSGATPINGNNQMKGAVVLDIRDLGTGNPTFYNGAGGNAQANKDLSRRWMEQRGYPGPQPPVGAQVTVLNGNWGANEMRKASYSVNDIIAVIVYDGYVWDTPGFAVTLTPQSANGIAPAYPNDATSAVAYNVSIAQAGGPWATHLMNFDLKFRLSETQALGTRLQMTDAYVANRDVTNSSFIVNNVVDSIGWNGTLKIFTPSASPTQTQQFISGLNVLVTASSGVHQGANSYYGFPSSGPADFAMSSDSGSLVVEQNSQINLNLYALGVNGASCANTPVQAHLMLPGETEDSWVSYFTAADQNSKVSINTTSPTKLQMTIGVNANAYPGTYTLRLTAGPCAGRTHSVDLPLEIRPASDTVQGQAKYVYIQGFAAFQITSIKGGEVDAKCISPLVPSLDQVTVGMKSRLVPWN